MTRRTRLGATALAVAVVLLFGLAAPASAHVTADPGTAPANGYAHIAFSVPHGCDGSATTALSMQIPDGVTSVTPEVAPGWEITTIEGPVTPYESDGNTVSTGIVEVDWSGGNLPDDRLQRFGLTMKMPDAPGETIYFPVVQTCEQGETAWIEIPEAGAEEPEHPAPGVELTAGEGAHGDEATATTTAGDDTAGTTVAVAAEGDEQAAGASTSGDDDGNGLAVVALIVGALGVVAGGLGIGIALRKQRS